MRLLGLPLFACLVLCASCGENRPAYGDRVRDLEVDDAHPRFVELARLSEGRPTAEVTNLVERWKQMLATESLSPPLVDGTTYTFVYYDPTELLNRVWLEASFSPKAPIPLWRWDKTHLFFRTFQILRPSALRYRFVSSATEAEQHVLPDLLHAAVDGANPPWSVFPDATSVHVLHVDATLEPVLQGQNLQVVLPPGYERDLSRTWPVLVLVGRGGTTWYADYAAAVDEGTLQPLVLVSLQPRSGAALTTLSLGNSWTANLRPWLSSHLRVDTSSTGVYLVGWGDAAPVVRDLAAAHGDQFPWVWTPPAGTPDTDASWSTLFVPVLKNTFSKVAP